MYKSETGLIGKEQSNDSREDLLTEPREVVYEKRELCYTGYDQQHHQPKTNHCTPLDVR